MGCTSSAPSMDGHVSDSYSVKNDSTNKSAEQDKESGSGDVKSVLPSCDNLEKNLELASQNSIKNGANAEVPHNDTNLTTSISTNNLDEETQEKQETNQENNDSNMKNEYENFNEEHYTTLREVVDKVMLDTVMLQEDHPSNGENVDEDYDYDDKVEEKSIPESDPPSEPIDIEDETKHPEVAEKVAEESKSPSQSELGRATRWEALADIAAELPPTLAVDPITGQIYSLAK